MKGHRQTKHNPLKENLNHPKLIVPTAELITCKIDAEINNLK